MRNKWYKIVENTPEILTNELTIREFKYYEVDSKGHMTMQKLYLDSWMGISDESIFTSSQRRTDISKYVPKR